MAELPQLEKDVRALLFSREPDLGRLDLPEGRQRVYRRLVQNGQRSVVENALPVLRAVWGEAETRALIERFLDEAGPKTRLYRAIPMDFSAWVSTLTDLPHAAIAELINFEVTQLEVLQAPDPEPGVRGDKPEDHLGVEFSPSARLLAYAHPVHTLKEDAAALPGPSRAPHLLMAFRSAERMRWLKLPAVVAQVLALSATQSLGDALDTFEAQVGSLDRPFVRSWLVNLRARGAILGFYEITE